MVAVVIRWCYKLVNNQLFGQCQKELSTIKKYYKKRFIGILLIIIKPTKLSLYVSRLINNIS